MITYFIYHGRGIPYLKLTFTYSATLKWMEWMDSFIHNLHFTFVSLSLVMGRFEQKYVRMKNLLSDDVML